MSNYQFTSIFDLMKTHQFIIFLFSSIVFYSCKKEPIKYIFEGTITENQNNLNLSSVKLEMFQMPFNNAVSSNSFQLAASTITNVNGWYQMEFERIKVTEFELHLTKEGFFKKILMVNAGEITSEDPNIIDAEMEAKAWVNFNITNVATANTTDELTLMLYKYRKGCEGCAVTDYNHFNGIVDTTFSFVTDAGEYFKFNYVQTGGTFYTDSIYLTAFDTLNYSIDY